MAPPPRVPNLEPRQFADAPRWLAKLLELLRAPLLALNAALNNGLTLRENHACVVHTGLVVTTPADNPTWGGGAGEPGPQGPPGEDGEDLTGTVVPVVRAAYRSNQAQAITNGVFNIIDFDGMEFDSDAAVTTGAAWKWTCPAGKGGTYLVAASVLGRSTVNGSVLAIASIFVNGVEKHRGGESTSASGLFHGDTVSGVLELVPGDYVDVRYYASTGTVAIDNSVPHATRFSIVGVNAGLKGEPGPAGPPFEEPNVVSARNTNPFSTNNTTTWQAVPGMSVTITTSGRPVQVLSQQSLLAVSSAYGRLTLFRDGINLGDAVVGLATIPVFTNATVPATLTYTDDVPAGTYTYALYSKAGAGTVTVSPSNMVSQITALELGAGVQGPPGDLTEAAADTRYVQKSGDTMTGPLALGPGAWVGADAEHCALWDATTGHAFLNAKASWYFNIDSNSNNVDTAGGGFAFGKNGTGDTSTRLATLREDGTLELEFNLRFVGAGASRPAASATYRGMLWFTQGGAGVADTIAICMKAAAGTYSWVNL